MAITDMRDLFLHELKDIYDAEQQLIKALPKMRDAATSEDLRDAFDMHLSETKEQARRIEEVFKLLNENADSKTCDAMKGLIKEGEQMMKGKMDDTLKDAGIVMAAQKVEHYEMSAYTSLVAVAKELKYDEAADLLQANLDEEEMTAQKLEKMAVKDINKMASAAEA